MAVRRVPVTTTDALEAAITTYISSGYVIQQQGTDFAVMVKTKKFEPLWAVIGFLFCLLPLAAYLIFYAVQSDQVVEIRVQAEPIQWTEDRTMWWDGSSWRALAEAGPPPSAPRSDDGAYFLDGGEWRLAPAQPADVEVVLRRNTDASA